ncbi:cramped chromatin regulator isoform X2 [Rhynchophorus ferrugineus]
MKLEQELDKKNEALYCIDVTSTQPNIVENNMVLNSPNTDQAAITICAGDKSLDTEIKGPQIRSSSRVIKKPKQDGAGSVVVDSKPSKKEEAKTDIKKVVRTNWSHEDKVMFFEAVNEYGKDFENIQQHINNKLKKKGASDDHIKTKDHVRQFYNRTFHEVSKHVKFSDRVKKVVQELYGIINYGELHKKLGSVSEKACMKLNELIYRGATVIRSKGKTIRIKTPMCKALIKMNQLDEKYEDVKLPNRVTVELRPKDMTSYYKIQSMAQNPRLRTTLPLQKRLSALIQFLNNRWKSRDAIEYEKSVISTSAVTIECVPPKQEILKNLSRLSPPLKLSPPPESRIDLPLINLSDYLTRQTICLTAYERRLGLDTFSDIKMMSKKKKQKIDNDQKTEILQEIKTDSKIDTLRSDETETSSCNEADPDASIADVVDDAISSIVLLQQRLDRQISETSETEECSKLDFIKQEIKEEEVQSEALRAERQEKIATIRKGWTESDSCSLTIGELYLMFGSDATLVLEYSWESDISERKDNTLSSGDSFLDRWHEAHRESLENKRKSITSALSKLLSVVKLQHRNNILKCQCGHMCDGKMVIKNGPMVSTNKAKKNTIVDGDVASDEQNTLSTTNQVETRNNQPSEPVYIQPKGPVQHTQTMQQQLNSIQRLKPKFCNRKGRRPRSKQVVVERKLPLLPNNLSGHQIVRMSIIPPQATISTEVQTSIPEDTSTPKLPNPEDENSIISTMPSSPSRILKEGDSDWINAEVADYSLSSLLGHLESPVKNSMSTSLASNMTSDLSNEVDAQLQSLLTENSVDFAANFADLAARVANDKKY